MGNFYLHKDGFLVQTGSCPDGQEMMQAPEGYKVGAGIPPIELQPRPCELPNAAALALHKRSELLQSSDWTQLPDVPAETKYLWVAYRQALRDITEQEGYPDTIVWPSKPEQ